MVVVVVVVMMIAKISDDDDDDSYDDGANDDDDVNDDTGGMQDSNGWIEIKVSSKKTDIRVTVNGDECVVMDEGGQYADRQTHVQTDRHIDSIQSGGQYSDILTLSP